MMDAGGMCTTLFVVTHVCLCICTWWIDWACVVVAVIVGRPTCEWITYALVPSFCVLFAAPSDAPIPLYNSSIRVSLCYGVHLFDGVTVRLGRTRRLSLTLSLRCLKQTCIIYH